MKLVGSIRAFLIVLVVSCGYSSIAAGWQIIAPKKFSRQSDTTITLQKPKPGKGSGKLWLDSRPDGSVIVPEFTSYGNFRAAFPIFVRANAEQLIVYDEADRTSTVIELRNYSSAKPGPEFRINLSESMPLAYASQGVTITLEAASASHFTGESVHVEASDHRGRRVFSKFFSKFDLLSNQGKIAIPSAGDFTIDVKCYKEPVTSMPASIIRQPIPIPFGLDLSVVKEAALVEDGVTTCLVMGSLVGLEGVPSTATLVGRDRLRLQTFAGQSNESRVNRWPFAANIGNAISTPLPLLQSRLNLEKSIGAGFSPVSIPWGQIQKGPGGFSWEKLSLLKLYRGSKVRPLLAIPGTALWNDQPKTASPEQLDAWTTVTRKIGSQFRPFIWGLHIWDYGKEWPNGPEIEKYQALIDATWQGFLKNDQDQVQPGPPLIIGGGEGFNQSFFQDLLTSEITAKVTGLAFTLPDNYNSLPDFQAMESQFTAAQAYAASLQNPRILLYLMGIAYASGPHAYSQQVQANYLVRTYVLAIAHGFYKVCWNALQDEPDTASGVTSGHGLFTGSLAPKPSAVAFNLTAYMLSGATSGSITRKDDVVTCCFDIPRQDNKWPGKVYVLWNENRSKLQQVDIKVDMAGGVFAQDYLGAEIPMVVNKSSVTVPVGFEPIFVWDAGGPPHLTKSQNDN